MAVLASVHAPVLPQAALSLRCGELGLTKLHGLGEVVGTTPGRFRGEL